MAINKIIHNDYGTLIDISKDTITADVLLKGYTAHGADGELIEGTHNGGVKLVEEFPSEDVDTGLIYKVHNQAKDKYTLYMYLNDKWVQFTTVSYDKPSEPSIAAGLYTDNTYTTMTTSWQELLDAGTVHVNDGVVKADSEMDGVLVFPDDGSVTTIGEMAFYTHGTNLTKILIYEGVTRIERNAFESCASLTEIQIPEGVTFIGDYAFNGCSSLTSVAIPDSVEIVGDHAFRDCTRLESVKYTEGETMVGNSVFLNCTSLVEIEIPAGVSQFGNSAFNGCSNLKSITILAEVPPSLKSNTFGGCISLAEIKVPASSVDAYKAADGWSEYADIIVAI